MRLSEISTSFNKRYDRDVTVQQNLSLLGYHTRRLTPVLLLTESTMDVNASSRFAITYITLDGWKKVVWSYKSSCYELIVLYKSHEFVDPVYQ